MQEPERRDLRQELLNLIEVAKNAVVLEASFDIDLCVKLPADSESPGENAEDGPAEAVHAVADEAAGRQTDRQAADAGQMRRTAGQKGPPQVVSGPPGETQTQPREDSPAGDMKPALDSPKLAALIPIQETANKCVKCALHKTRTNVVFGVGSPDADLMFVGEAPGYYEDVQGEPFVGRAGQLLTKIINAIGMRREDVYIANILKCRPPDNRNPLPEEIVLCSPYLRRQIEIIQPKIICALGAFAAQTLLSSKQSIGALRGKFHDYEGIKLIATYHPAYLLRNPADKRKTWGDILRVAKALQQSS